MAEDYTLAKFDDLETVEATSFGVSWVELSDALGCEKLRARVWHIEPDGSLKYHRQHEQEELYVPLDGPGQLRIDDEVVDVPAGSAVRVPPETPRQPINETSETHVWLIVGAPPVDDDATYLETGDDRAGRRRSDDPL